MNFDTLQLEIFLLNDFFLDYIDLEKVLKEKVLQCIEQSTDIESKHRLFFYLGWKNEIRFIDFDTFETKLEVNKFDEEKQLNKLTLNNLVKLNKKEHFFNSKLLDIDSSNEKMTTLNFNTQIIKIIKMRNYLAHEYSNAKLDSKLVVEVLNKDYARDKLIQKYHKFDDKIALNNITEKSLYLYSNIHYMQKVKEQLTGKS